MKNQPPRRNPTPQAAPPGATPSEKAVTPSPGIPLDILDTTVRRLLELTPQVKMTFNLVDIIRDAVVMSYERGQADQRAEANLIMESMDRINDRRHDRLTDLIVSQCMHALGVSEMTVDLSHDPEGVLTVRLDENNRSIVHYTYSLPSEEPNEH